MKKAGIAIIVIAVAGVVLYTLNTEWRGNDNNKYTNTKHGYSLQHPPEWNMMGDSESDILMFYNTENPPGDGGVPAGIAMEIMVLENYDNLELDEWVDQMNSRGPDAGQTQKEETTVGGKSAIRTTSLTRFESEVPPIGIYLEKDSYILLVHYKGSEPDYGNNMNNFEMVLRSFSFR